MRKKQIFISIALVFFAINAFAENENPILSGFNPDPSICRVGDDYYLCCSSFTWYPGLPIYHSRDLLHWELVANAIDRAGMVSLDGVLDKDGVWAPTLRWHEGMFYIFSNVSNRGNFYIKSTNICGPWSDPIWIKDTPGIDPSIFWDDDGRAYLAGNTGKFPDRKYQASTCIWLQEIDLEEGKIKGERHYLTTGHALNATYAEGPHLYKIHGRYVLVVAEGGTDFYHATSVFTSDSIFGPYLPQKINPVISQRQFGKRANIQCIGHADLVETQQGDLFAVCLGKRMIDGQYTFTRETFLCPVSIEDKEFVFNPGKGGMTFDIEKPNLPSSPVDMLSDRDDFEDTTLRSYWYFERIPHTTFYDLEKGKLYLHLTPESIDSLVSPSLIMRRTRSHQYSAETHLSFKTKRSNERAGMVLHRNNKAYVALLKTKDTIEIVESGKRKTAIPYNSKEDEVTFRITANDLIAVLEYGADSTSMCVADTVSLIPLTEDNKLNRFNGLGIGMYASAEGKTTKAVAEFEYFTYSDEK